MPFVAIRINLEYLNKQSQKDTYYMTSLICGI